MGSTRQSILLLIRQVGNVVLVVLGLCLVIGFIDLSPTSEWLPWLLLATGIVTLSSSSASLHEPGIIITLVGLYLILRFYDVISLPVLQYVLGATMATVGIVHIVRIQKGDTPSNNTLS